jgi:hypothetical protein
VAGGAASGDHPEDVRPSTSRGGPNLPLRGCPKSVCEGADPGWIHNQRSRIRVSGAASGTQNGTSHPELCQRPDKPVGQPHVRYPGPARSACHNCRSPRRCREARVRDLDPRLGGVSWTSSGPSPGPSHQADFVVGARLPVRCQAAPWPGEASVWLPFARSATPIPLTSAESGASMGHLCPNELPRVGIGYPPLGQGMGCSEGYTSVRRPQTRSVRSLMTRRRVVVLGPAT